MDLQLKDKVVIVTGGAKGIGAAIVHACAAEGAIPVIVGRDAESGKQLQSELKTKKAKCGVITVELSTAESCAQSVEQTLREFGRIDAGAAPILNASPAVTLTAPTGTVSGTVNVSVTVQSNVAIAKVEFFAAGVTLGAVSNGSDGGSPAWPRTSCLPKSSNGWT